jgi:hypothetical protein
MRPIVSAIILASCAAIVSTAATAQSRGLVHNQLPKPNPMTPAQQQAMRDAAARLVAQKAAKDAATRLAAQKAAKDAAARLAAQNAMKAAAARLAAQRRR